MSLSQPFFSQPFAWVAAAALGLSGAVQAAGVVSVGTPPGAPSTTVHHDMGARIDALAASADALPRDRRASLVGRLTALGPAAADALLARVSADSAAMAALRTRDLSAARAFDAALLETLGKLREPRALPALNRAFASVTADPRTAQAAADGLGRLCDAGGFAPLAAAARTSDGRAARAWTALGLCRTEPAATLLADRLNSAREGDEVRTLAEALGSLGSTWAWQSMGDARSAEGARVRRTAATALRRALTQADARTSAALREALRMVGE
jgi:hypothetical protein